MRIIGLVGRARHGKDSAANVLIEEFGFTRYAFADALREMAYDIDPIMPYRKEAVPEELYERLPGLPQDGEYPRYSEVVNSVGYDDAKKLPEVRRFLQNLGTEGVRKHFGDGAWIELLGRKIARESTQNVVITDCRFPNEASWIRGFDGGALWKITRVNADGSLWDNEVGSGHASEQHIDSIRVDTYIEACSLNELHEAVRSAVDVGR